jgi:hypothetical protein
MARRSRLKKHLTNSSTHKYALFGLTAFFFGIIAAFMITQVLAQTADTNQIYACVDKTNGAMRQVDSETPCRKSEDSIKWSIQGPPGPQGPAGDTGGLNEYFGLPFFCNNCFFSNLGTRFVEKDFSYAQIVRSAFDDTDMHGVKFNNAYLRSNTFNNANLTGADMSDMQALPNFGYSRDNSFQNANLSNVNFSNSYVQDSDFRNANLSNANFTNAIIKGSNFQGATNMSSATFAGATWDNSTCPDGTNSNSNGNTCANHL